MNEIKTSLIAMTDTSLHVKGSVDGRRTVDIDQLFYNRYKVRDDVVIIITVM